MEMGRSLPPDFAAMTVNVPGSVQAALRANGHLPDWLLGTNSLACEWVEHRHWEFFTSITLPENFREVRFEAEQLDHSGWILVDGKIVDTFNGALTRHCFDLGGFMQPGKSHELGIVFDVTPAEQGQMGFTSRSTHFKPRFSYGWDWCPRFVPIGIGPGLRLLIDPPAMQVESVRTELSADLATGSIHLRTAAQSSSDALLLLTGPQGEKTEFRFRFEEGRSPTTIPIENPQLWWPNGEGEQPRYHVEVLSESGESLWSGDVGFKHIQWLPCMGAPDGAEPWICEVNGRPVFLQGVNWTPVSLDYLSDHRDDMHTLIGLYRDMGCNLLRVWGGAYLESQAFYQAADRAGLMVWQEFPLSSSGIDNWPPEDPSAIDRLELIATDFVRRRSHHASLLLWCGGNELQRGKESKAGIGYPADLAHPCLARLGKVVERESPGIRYLPTSASGPRFTAEETDFGKGLHHDVHGPWNISGTLDDWKRYWENDDALFRSETGMPGTMTAKQIEHYANGLCPWPPEENNLYWMLTCAWWRQWGEFQKTSEPQTLAAYCEWSRALQAEALQIAAKACKDSFPRCGGFLLWMGHDCFPCAANTAVIDITRQPKPAYDALSQVFKS